nr:hypothetical protein [Tanacetum cinerariifolium]
MGDRGSFNSKEDLTQRIPKTVFVTTFPYHFSAHDLWNVCVAYGKVIEVYIPLKKSKEGKNFAFVRFLMVDNLDHLVDNLCTIWISRFRLHANSVRFQRETRAYSSQSKKGNEGSVKSTFASVLKFGKPKPIISDKPSPAIVLDDSCLMEKDFSCSLMGKIKDINALSKLYVILANEGFENVKLTDEIIVWISVEGLPIKMLTRNTFAKIVSPWGKLTDIRVKELEAWILDFGNELEDNSSADEHSEDVEEEHIMEKRNDYPFGIFMLLNMKNDMEESQGEDPIFPPGFTPDKVDKNVLVNINLHSSNDGISSVKSGNKHVLKIKPGGSILEVMEDVIEVAQTMGYNMEGCLKNIKAIIGFQGDQRKLNRKHRVNFVAIQETKMENIDLFSIKEVWGNLAFDYAISPSVGFSGGILYAWDLNLFIKDNVTSSDSFLAIQGANAFNHFITMVGLIDLPLEGYSYTWAHKSASNMSKLDRFLIIRKNFDQGKGNKRLVNERSMLLQELQDLNTSASLDMAQKAKIHWSIEGDKNSKYFHGIINKKSLESQFSTRISLDQVDDLERNVSYDEIKRSFWDCGSNKSYGLDGFTFDFLRRYWNVIDQEVVNAVFEFFLSSLYKGIHIDESLTLAHLFYADDAVFVGKWDKSNLITIVNVLKCFLLASVLKINLHKSKLMGIVIP